MEELKRILLHVTDVVKTDDLGRQGNSAKSLPPDIRLT